jgi:hypothetical protein
MWEKDATKGKSSLLWKATAKPDQALHDFASLVSAKWVTAKVGPIVLSCGKKALSVFGRK